MGRATVIAEKAFAGAEKANQEKSDFLSSMSHELRTPLGPTLSFAQLIRLGTPAPTPKQKRNPDQVLQAGWYLLDMINEILDLALIESVTLSDVLVDCEAMTEPHAEKHAIDVSFQDITFPCIVTADRTRLKQVLINFISNAVKYNKLGGTVVISCNLLPQRVRINVKDSGQGLTPENISQLFQPFNRLEQENKSEEGTGIGLVLTKYLIELMGGEIGLESNLGEGSTFWVELPLSLPT